LLLLKLYYLSSPPSICLRLFNLVFSNETSLAFETTFIIKTLISNSTNVSVGKSSFSPRSKNVLGNGTNIGWKHEVDVSGSGK